LYLLRVINVNKEAATDQGTYT